MSVTHVLGNIFHDRLQAASRHFFWTGLAMVFVGIVALVFPVVSTLAAAIFVGAVFLAGGAVSLMGSFSIHGTGPFFGALLTALIAIAAGVFLLFNPLAGEVALTLVMVIVFSLQGAFEIAIAFEIRNKLPGWAGMLFSGICSIVIAVLIAAGWPAISGIALGILLGVNFLSTGVGYLAISQAVKPPR